MGRLDIQVLEAGGMCSHQFVVCPSQGRDGFMSSWANGVYRLSSLGYIRQVDINLHGNTTSMPGTSCLNNLDRRCLPKSGSPLNLGNRPGRY